MFTPIPSNSSQVHPTILPPPNSVSSVSFFQQLISSMFCCPFTSGSVVDLPGAAPLKKTDSLLQEPLAVQSSSSRKRGSMLHARMLSGFILCR